MKRLNLLLVIAIAVEAGAGAIILHFASAKAAVVKPPIPDLTNSVDPILSRQILDRAANCRTPADWSELAELYHAYGYFAEGEACYRHIRDQEPDNPNWWYYWAFAMERMGRPEQAVAGYKEAAARGHADLAGCWYCIGQNYLRMQDVESAQAAFEKAGNYLAAFYERAKLLTRSGQYDRAVALLDQIAHQDTLAIDPWLLRHKIEVLRDRPVPAAVYADKAKRLLGPNDLLHLPNPLFSREWGRLEDAYNRIGHEHKVEEAKKLLAERNWAGVQSVLQDEPQSEWDPEAAMIRAKAAFFQGRYAEMAQLAQEIIERSGSSALALDALGDAYSALGQSEKAAGAWSKAVTLGNGRTVVEAYRKLAEYDRKSGKKAEANSNESRSRYAFGHDQFWKGKFGEAQSAFEEAVKLDPAFAAAWFYLGDSSRLLGQTAKAREAYQHCLKIDPNFGRAYRGIDLLDAKP